MVSPKNGAASKVDDTCSYTKAEKKLEALMEEFKHNNKIQEIADKGINRIRTIKNSPLMDVTHKSANLEDNNA